MLVQLFQGINMLNLTLLYFIIIGSYYLGRKYIPKMHELIKLSSRIMKDNPLIITASLLSGFILIHPEKDFLTNKILQLGLAEEGISQIPEAFQEMFQGSETEILLYRIFTLLLAA
jgi:hypothetical protein